MGRAMPNDAVADQSVERELSVSGLAEELGRIAHTMATVLPDIAADDARGALAGYVDNVRSVCSSLHSIDSLQDPAYVRRFGNHSEGLRQLAETMEQTVDELRAANDQASEDLSQHVDKLDRIAQTPSPEGPAAQLRATVSEARKMAHEMHQSFDAIAAKVGQAAGGIMAMRAELEAAREKAFIDALTRLHSRSALNERLDAAVREAEARGPWYFLLVEVDHFDEVVQTHGRVLSDALLFKIARQIEEATPAGEDKCFLTRYAHQQFALILWDCARAEARAVAEGLRQRVAETCWQPRQGSGKGLVRVTLSVGVACYDRGDTTDTLVQRAKRALLQARQTGRNTVAIV